MNDKELFYERIQQEYDEFMELWRDWDADSIIDAAEYIGDFKQIYEYLMRDKPIDENSYLEHYMKLNKPLQTICDLYQEEKSPIYDSLNHTLWSIGDQQIYGDDFSEEKFEFMQRIEDNYNEMRDAKRDENLYNDLYMAREYIKHHIGITEDKDITTLMQFENPLKVIMESPLMEESTKNKIAMAAHYIRWSDIYTMPYELDHKRIVPESRFRHDAIIDLVRIIPNHNFDTTMQWLDFFRDLNGECDKTANPYQKFVDTMYDIADEHPIKILQKLYNMSHEHCILENELCEAAKYLADGGAIEAVPELAKYGYFDGPYEENTQSAEEFLKSIDEPHDGLTMV